MVLFLHDPVCLMAARVVETQEWDEESNSCQFGSFRLMSTANLKRYYEKPV
ncbi:MAG: hypothetical protein ACM3PP_12885 [Candidatus Saccharibacteria bacterium]